MPESVLLTAFIIGIVSAVSLPMGAITTFAWRPSDRSLAILMAFGGGALLAALTIDLAGSALETGHFNQLALGAIIGGLLFIILNRIVNNYGGFLRKLSTTVYHLRRQQHQQLRRIASQLNRADLFRKLPNRDYRQLAPSIARIDVKKGSWIYQNGDPADHIYIIVAGTVELVAPDDPTQAIEKLREHDAFGIRAVIAGTPCGHAALATTDVSLLALPKHAIDALLIASDDFRKEVHGLFSSENIRSYLQQYHGLSDQQARDWLLDADYSLTTHGTVTPAIEVVRNSEQFRNRLDELQHIPLLQNLSANTRDELSERLIYKHFARGSSFYQRGDIADRIFIIDHGEVQLFGLSDSRRDAMTLHGNDVFGDISTIIGARHSVTAVAATDCAVWELRKSDLDELVMKLPELPDRIRNYIHQAENDGYLVDRQKLDEEHTRRWARQALRNIDTGLPVPPAADLRHEAREINGVPLAIWTGILLDGIPESLVIGASMIHAELEISLILGLFLSNYPEALSSSVGMRTQGISRRNIVLMWSSIMLFTGIGAAAGSVFFVGASLESYALVEGIAVGAMLTMIAETMLPEAYLKGGSVVGMSTLMGFLVAIFSKTFE